VLIPKHNTWGGGGDRDTSIIDLDISREPHALSEEREPDIY
jgi:hypothetical protein